jgi:predicted permease
MVAILSLALGIGVNTAVLAVGRAVLVQPLPVTNPEQLAVAYWWRGDETKGVLQLASGGAKDPATGRSLNSNYNYATYTALRETLRGQADLFAFTFLRQANVSVQGRSAVGGAMLVSGNYFAALGVPMHLGRGLVEADDRMDAPPAAVLGYGLWQRAFGGDPGIVGSTVHVNGQPFTVAGIAARGYFGVSNGGFFPPAEVTVPLASHTVVNTQWKRWMDASGTLYGAANVHWLRIMARVKPGADRASVQAALSTTFAQHLRQAEGVSFKPEQMPAIVLIDGARGLESMRSAFEKPLLMLGGVAALVFLLACVNLAGLMLARGVARQQEFWLRLALGAGRGRLVRQTFVESLVLAVTGGVLGILLAVWGSRTLIALTAGSWPTALDVRLDLPLMLLGLAVSTVAAVGFGMFPAVRLASGEHADLMRQTGPGAAAPRLRAGRALLAIQIAVSVPLLVGALLFLRTLYNYASVDLGFEPRGLIVFKMDPSLNGYDEARTKGLYERVLERLQRVEGVRSVTLVENSLVSGWVSNTSFSVDGQEPKSTLMNRVGPGFFETVGLPVLSGRGIGLQDTSAAPRVAVINEAAAKIFFGASNPLGRHFNMGRRTPGRPAPIPLEVVGVVRDSKYDSLKKAPTAIIYLPYAQSTGLGAMHVAVRTTSSAGMSERLRAAVGEVDPNVPATDMKSQRQQIDETIGSERALTMLLVVFGLFALLVACIGLHGVTAYAVARRTSEIGIRVALGAQRGDVLWMILRQVVVLAVIGLALGIPAAVATTKAAKSLLYGVEPADPWSLAAGAGVLFVVAVAAGFLPARRAATLDPLVALRTE